MEKTNSVRLDDAEAIELKRVQSFHAVKAFLEELADVQAKLSTRLRKQLTDIEAKWWYTFALIEDPKCKPVLQREMARYAELIQRANAHAEILTAKQEEFDYRRPSLFEELAANKENIAVTPVFSFTGADGEASIASVEIVKKGDFANIEFTEEELQRIIDARKESTKRALEVQQEIIWSHTNKENAEAPTQEAHHEA